MQWHNAARDYLPGTSRSVLISFKGIYHIAFFSKERKDFTFLQVGTEKTLRAHDALYWTDIDNVAPARPKCILVVEDDPDDQYLISMELRKQLPDVHVEYLSDGQEALDYLLKKGPFKGGTRKPDLILLDLNLPKIDGFGILTEVGKHEHLKDIVIFVVSTSKSPDQWDKALNLGARCFFSKGSSSADLTKIVKEICANLN